MLGVVAVRAEEVREVAVEQLPWSLAEYAKTLPMPEIAGDIPLRLRHGEQVVEGTVWYSGDGNVAMLVNESWAPLRTAVDNGVLHLEPSWGVAELSDLNGDGFFDLALSYKDAQVTDDDGKLLRAPVPQWTQMEIFLYDTQQKLLVPAAWSFASHPEGGEEGYPYRLEIEQREADSEAVAVWRSLKPMALLGYVETESYAVVFFADPLIRPYGNIILAWRLVKGKPPELIFATPYSASVGIAYELQELSVKAGCVSGSISAKLVKEPRRALTFPIELSEKTLPIHFSPPSVPRKTFHEPEE